MNLLRTITSALTLGLLAALVILYLPYLLAGALVAVGLLMLMGLIAWFWFRHKLRSLSKQFEQQLNDLGGPAGPHQRGPDRVGEPNPLDDQAWPGERSRPKQTGNGPVIHIQPEEIPRKD